MDSFFSHPFVWFFLGVFTYRLIVRIMAYMHAMHIYSDAIISSLSIYRLSDTKIRNINNARYVYLEKEKEFERLEKERDVDRAVLAMWRTVCIASLINQVPRHMRRMVKFHDWKTAMAWLDSLAKDITVNKF